MKKKWIAAGIVLIVIAIVMGILIGRGTASGPGLAEPDEYNLTGKTDVSPNIPSETAKLIEVTYKYDEEWAATGMFILQVTIKNNSNRSIDRADVSLRIFDGKNGVGNELFKRSSFASNMPPGKSETFGLGGTILLEDLKNPKSFVLTLENLTWKGAVEITPVAVANETPSQAVKNFLTAMLEGRYIDAQKYSYNPEQFTYLKEDYEKNPQKRVVRVVVLKEEIYKEYDSATVLCIFYFADGTSEKGAVDLVLVDGKWKF